MENKARFILLAIFLGLSACQADWSDPNKGAAVRNAIMSQSVYPNGRPNIPSNGGGLSGVAAKATIDNYQRSFVVPALGAGGAAAPAPTAGGVTPP